MTESIYFVPITSRYNVYEFTFESPNNIFAEYLLFDIYRLY